MKSIILFTALLVTSCSVKIKKGGVLSVSFDEPREYEYELLDYASNTTHLDIIGQTIYSIPEHENLQEIIIRYQKEGRINSDYKLSCFNDSQSTNYINILESYIFRIRPYVSQSQYEIIYRSVDLLHEGKIRTYYLEHRTNKVVVVSKLCYRKIEGKYFGIISEKYSLPIGNERRKPATN